MQAQFLCLAHNLMLLMESVLQSKQQIINHKEIRRAKQPGYQAEESAKRQIRKISPLYLNPFRRSQMSVKFIRWLKHHLDMNSTMRHAAESLQMVYAKF